MWVGGYLVCGSLVGSIVVSVWVCVWDACACLRRGLKFKFGFQMAMDFLYGPALWSRMCVCILFYDWRVKNAARLCVCVCAFELCKNILKLRRRRLQQNPPPPYICSIVVFWFRSLFCLPFPPCFRNFICHSCMHTCAERPYSRKKKTPNQPFLLLWTCHPLGRIFFPFLAFPVFFLFFDFVLFYDLFWFSTYFDRNRHLWWEIFLNK